MPLLPTSMHPSDFDMAMAASLSYRRPKAMAMESERFFGRRAAYIENGNFQAGVFGCNEGAIVAVRGSDELLDWLGNGKWGKVRHAKGFKAHEGFAIGCEMLYDGIVRELRALMTRWHRTTAFVHMPVYLTGHSMGGGISPLLSIALADGGFNVQNLVTFGAPHCGSGKLARIIKSELPHARRYVLESDVVPYLLSFSTLHHVGALQWITGMSVSDSAPWFSRLWARLTDRDSWLLEGLIDHPMERYLNRVERLHEQGTTPGSIVAR